MAATVTVPGRLELIAERPPTYLDAAHNPAGAAALARSLPAVAAGRRVVACLAILADKDAAAMVAALAPGSGPVVCTELPRRRWSGTGDRAPARGRRRSSPAPVRGRPAGRGRARLRRCPRRARELAAGPPEGAPARHRFPLCNRPRRAAPDRHLTVRGFADGSPRSAGSELLSMMGLVAAVVAIVILVFFGVGYLFGRLFL